MDLDPSQQAALDLAARERVMVLTGGPGRGKTTVLREIVARWEALARGPILLCAPTGKAAKRMTEQTGREASTIHRLLCAYPCPLETAAAVVIDEASMVPTTLMAALLARLPRRARLLVVGDADQLPSIGAGQVLRDLIGSGRVPVARLTTIHRQAGGEASWICQNADRILAGEMPRADNAASPDYFWVDAGDGEQGAERAAALVPAAIDRACQRFGADPLRDVCVITPKRKEGAPLRAGRFNEALQARYNPAAQEKAEWPLPDGTTLREGDRVRHTVNDYDLGVFNGEVGHCVSIRPGVKGRVGVDVDLGDRTVTYSRDSVGELALAYAGTCHAQQGSGYPIVVGLVHDVDAWMLSRPLVYTMLTRAERCAVLIGSERGMRAAVGRDGDYRRVTRLRERLVHLDVG